MSLLEIKGSAHCAFCRQLDFLPFKCGKCEKMFCKEHKDPPTHECAFHLSSQSSVALMSEEDAEKFKKFKRQRKKRMYPCCVQGCKNNDLQSNICKVCGNNYCLRHRYPSDHECKRLMERKSKEEQGIRKDKQEIRKDERGISKDEQGKSKSEDSMA